MRKKLLSTMLVAVFSISISGIANAQEPEMPTASPEHAVLKKDRGAWDCKMKMWMGPGDPEESTGSETNKMVGDFWLISSFKGTFGGMDFTGSGTMGYDPKTKKYVGTWVDSMTPTVTHMSGTFDKKTQTMTLMGEGMGADGGPMKTKNVTVYKDDGSRVMTMYTAMPGSDEMMKTLEIIYTKRAKKKKSESK